MKNSLSFHESNAGPEIVASLEFINKLISIPLAFLSAVISWPHYIYIYSITYIINKCTSSYSLELGRWVLKKSYGAVSFMFFQHIGNTALTFLNGPSYKCWFLLVFWYPSPGALHRLHYIRSYLIVCYCFLMAPFLSKRCQLAVYSNALDLSFWNVSAEVPLSTSSIFILFHPSIMWTLFLHWWYADLQKRIQRKILGGNNMKILKNWKKNWTLKRMAYWLERLLCHTKVAGLNAVQAQHLAKICLLKTSSWAYHLGVIIGGGKVSIIGTLTYCVQKCH